MLANYRYELIVYYLGVINVITFLVFGIDKYLAMSKLRRVPEKVFYLLAALGGSIGALVGSEVFKHKRRKISFMLVILFILLVQAAAVYFLVAEMVNNKESMTIDFRLYSQEIKENKIEIKEIREIKEGEVEIDRFHREEIVGVGAGLVPVQDEEEIDSAQERATTRVAPTNSGGNIVIEGVPFFAQAPFGEWDDPKQQDACEEAAVLIAWHWVEGDKEVDKLQAKQEILEMIEWEIRTQGNYIDTSATSTTQMMRDYFGYNRVETKEIKEIREIKYELLEGNLVIVPVNGQVIGNKYYTPPGPERHMIVIIGYDDSSGEFITNDAGTRWGEGYRYDCEKLFSAIRNYLTGDHALITEDKKMMIVVSKV